MYFEQSEILLSVISATLLGIIFAFFCIFIRLIYRELYRLFLSLKEAVFYERIFARVKLCELKKTTPRLLLSIGAFLQTLTFGVLYILISYYSLDGALRAYTLVLALIFYLLVDKFLSRKIFLLFERIFSPIFVIFVYILRIFCFPVRTFAIKICKKLRGLNKKQEKSNFM